MTIEEYSKVLWEMDDIYCLPKAKHEEYVKATYDGNVMLIKPSLYFRLVRQPWHLLCTPFNKALRWLGRHMPLYDVTGQPMNDNYIHLTAMLQMAGFIPLKEYGWHAVDARPIAEMEPETFKKYFGSQCKATGQMPKDKAVEFLDTLYSDYVENYRIHEIGGFHRFTSKDKARILGVIEKTDPDKSFVLLNDPGCPQLFRANFNINRNHYLYIEANKLSLEQKGAPSVIVKVSWAKQNDDNDMVKHQIWYNGDCLGWLMRRIETLAPVYRKALDEKWDKAIEKYETLNK